MRSVSIIESACMYWYYAYDVVCLAFTRYCHYQSCMVHDTQIGLYKIFVYFETVVHESPILSFPPPTCIAYPGTTPLHAHWTVYNSPSHLPCVCYTLYNIDSNNIVSRPTHEWRVGGSSYIAQTSCNSIAVVWVMQMGGGNTGMMDSCTDGL